MRQTRSFRHPATGFRVPTDDFEVGLRPNPVKFSLACVEHKTPYAYGCSEMREHLYTGLESDSEDMIPLESSDSVAVSTRERRNLLRRVQSKERVMKGWPRASSTPKWEIEWDWAAEGG